MVGPYGFFGGQEPVGFGEECREYVGEIKAAGYQEYFFDLAVTSLHYQKPDGDAGERHRNIFADAENLHGGGYAGEFGDGVAQVHGQGGDHYEEGGAEAEFFADQVGEAFAGDYAHARAHFFGDVERDGHGDEGPEHGVAELRAGGGVGGDAAGVVVYVGGD